MSNNVLRNVPLSDLTPPKVLPQLVRERLQSPVDVISGRVACKHFSYGSSPSLRRDCIFLNIPTSDGLGGPSLTKTRMFVLYAFYCWRKNFMDKSRSEYWEHVATKEAIESGEPLDSTTASKEGKMAFMIAGGGSLDDFNQRWKDAVSTMRSRSKVLSFVSQ